MTKWAYLWRQTYYAETSRSEGYAQLVYYGHMWKPDKETEQPFPSQDGIDTLGAAGWELVSMVGQKVSLLSRVSPQGDSYMTADTYLLMFKRPVTD